MMRLISVMWTGWLSGRFSRFRVDIWCRGLGRPKPNLRRKDYILIIAGMKSSGVMPAAFSCHSHSQSRGFLVGSTLLATAAFGFITGAIYFSLFSYFTSI
jgi:hypothetical protein